MLTILTTTAVASWKVIVIVAVASGVVGGTVGSAFGGPVTGAVASTISATTTVVLCGICSILAFLVGYLLC